MKTIVVSLLVLASTSAFADCRLVCPPPDSGLPCVQVCPPTPAPNPQPGTATPVPNPPRISKLFGNNVILADNDPVPLPPSCPNCTPHIPDPPPVKLPPPPPPPPPPSPQA